MVFLLNLWGMERGRDARIKVPASPTFLLIC